MSMRHQAGIVLPGYNALKVANAPTIGTATAASGTSVSVTFTAPACVGGGAISSFTAFANCGIYKTTGASSPLVVTGLTNGTAYTFKAIATNAYGPSYPSAASNSATTFSVPGAPTIGTATATSSSTATVAYTAPASDGGSTITSYTATSSPGGITGTLSQAGSGTITVSGLTPVTSYTFTVTATNAIGTGSASAASNSITTSAAVGQQAYTTAGSYSWVAPAGVTSVAVVAVGGGGSGNRSDQNSSKGGGGGGLGYKNNYSVTAGSSYTVVVGAGGTGYPCVSTVGNSGSDSYFVSTGVVKGGGGIGGAFSPSYSNYGTFTGDGGGNGGGTACASNQGGGGGGAGGYAGNCSSPSISGGRSPGNNSPGCAGLFGAGGGGGGDFNGNGGGGGGGVGLLGQGCSGAGGAAGGNTSTRSGAGGSGGSSGGGVYAYGGFGGAYGGGGGSGGRGGNPCGGRGGVGAVRIIWPGSTRSFPSTNTGDL